MTRLRLLPGEPCQYARSFLWGSWLPARARVGQELARRLGWDFVDLDLRIQAREGQTVAEIFRDRANPVFAWPKMPLFAISPNPGSRYRSCSRRRSLRPGPQPGVAAALAFGIPGNSVGRTLEALHGRLNRTPFAQRPAEFARLYESRLPFYRQATVTVVTSGKDPVSLCAEIERTLQFRGETEGESSPQASPAHFETGESQ